MDESSRESNPISESEMAESHLEYVVGDCPKENCDSLMVKDDVEKVYEEHDIVTESELNDEDKFNLIVFVGNLSEETTIENVKKLFSKEIGLLDNEVLEVSMLWKVKIDSKQFGFTFVEFVNKQAFEKALTLNNSFHFGQNLLVLPSVKTHCGLFCMEKLKPEIKKDIKVIKTEPRNSSDNDFVPVYKKSDYVAYLKNLPPDSTKDNVLQFLNFSEDDVIDIHIIKLHQRKTNAKPKKFRAVIAFPSEENLKKCLSQNGKTFQNNWIEIQRHVMSKSTSTDDKQSSKLGAINDAKEKTASPNKKESHSAFEKDSSKTDKVELDLFLKHVNWNASERHIPEFFASVGARVVGIKQFSDSAQARGMGFVSMANKKSVLKGLALNGAIFLGNKIKVSVRNDRKFMVPPIEGEAPSFYSTFVANLPIKISADTLKSALMDYFKKADILVESIYVPLAHNHSGNRGYAFVIFQNEKSLSNALKLNRREIRILSSRVNVIVSKNWPQNPKENSDLIAKPKEHDNRRVNPSTNQESPRNERLLNRKRKATTSPHRGGISKSNKSTPKKFASLVSSPVGFGFEQSQPCAPIHDTYSSEYKAYLQYLEFRDYVARRETYDEQQTLPKYQTRHHAGHEEQFLQNQKDNQTNFSMNTHSSFIAKPATSFQDRFQEPEEENVNNGWRQYSSSLPIRNVSGEYDHPTTPGTSTIIYEKPLRIPESTTTGGYDYLPQTVPSTSYSSYEKFPLSASLSSTTPTSKEKFDIYPLVSYPIDRYGKGSRYSSDDKNSLQTNSKWSSSKTKNVWDRRDDKASLQETTPLFELRSGDLRSNKSDKEGDNWVSYPATNSVRSRNYDHYGFNDH